MEFPDGQFYEPSGWRNTGYTLPLLYDAAHRLAPKVWGLIPSLVTYYDPVSVDTGFYHPYMPLVETIDLTFEITYGDMEFETVNGVDREWNPITIDRTVPSRETWWTSPTFTTQALMVWNRQYYSNWYYAPGDYYDPYGSAFGSNGNNRYGSVLIESTSGTPPCCIVWTTKIITSIEPLEYYPYFQENVLETEQATTFIIDGITESEELHPYITDTYISPPVPAVHNIYSEDGCVVWFERIWRRPPPDLFTAVEYEVMHVRNRAEEWTRTSYATPDGWEKTHHLEGKCISISSLFIYVQDFPLPDDRMKPEGVDEGIAHGWVFARDGSHEWPQATMPRPQEEDYWVNRNNYGVVQYDTVKSPEAFDQAPAADQYENRQGEWPWPT